MSKKKILVLPSWYASPEAPTSGSFFKEQAELMQPEFDVKVLVADKRWISWRRYAHEKIRPYLRPFLPFFLNTPPTLLFEFDFIKRFSLQKNFEIKLHCYTQIIQRIIEEGWKPDLIHAHSTFQGGILARHISKQFGIPYIITEHIGPFVLQTYIPFWQAKIVDAMENATEVLAVSEHQKQHILMNEIKCRPITVGNFVNEELFNIQPIVTAEFTILFVAYYPNFIKDIETFFKTLCLLKSSNIKVKIIGGGEMSGDLNKNIFDVKANEYEVSEMIKIIPQASREEMNQHFATSHILVSTSIAESFGVAICEAMLCGRPAVVTCNGGSSDYIAEGVNGYIVPIQNPEALAAKIMSIKDNYVQCKPELIRQIIIDRYGMQVFKDRIALIYKNSASKMA